MKYPALTDKQQAFFNAIVTHLQTHEHWPTIQELMDELGYSSPRSISQLYETLIEKHYLIKTGWGAYDFHPVQQYRLEDRTGSTQEGIPIVGLITAGGLQEAVEEEMGRVTLESLLPNYEHMRAVVVSGQSMKEAGIFDGDIVLLARTEIFDGEIGAVRYRGETSLKRIYRTATGMKLVPENESYDPIVIHPGDLEEVQVIGKYVGHINEKGLHKP